VDERDGALTAREHEVLELVRTRLRDDEIAERLGIARSTAALLLRSAMHKLEARTRLEAVAKLDGNPRSEVLARPLCDDAAVRRAAQPE
jgi:DNA-binding CsgD family transcriptional regulator